MIQSSIYDYKNTTYGSAYERYSYDVNKKSFKIAYSHQEPVGMISLGK